MMHFHHYKQRFHTACQPDLSGSGRSRQQCPTHKELRQCQGIPGSVLSRQLSAVHRKQAYAKRVQALVLRFSEAPCVAIGSKISTTISCAVKRTLASGSRVYPVTVAPHKNKISFFLPSRYSTHTLVVESVPVSVAVMAQDWVEA